MILEKTIMINNDLINLLQRLDRETFLHGKRVGEMLYEFGHFLNLSEHHSSQLQLIGYLHDIGKLNIPLSILNKYAPLTDFEWNIIKKHAIFGYNILEPIIEQKEILYAVRYHHENIDGTGYEGLIGSQIDFNSRLVRIIDSFDALMNDRCYQLKCSTELSLNKIIQLAGTTYDVDLVNQFIKFINKKSSYK